jgi:hypothetical protein
MAPRSLVEASARVLIDPVQHKQSGMYEAPSAGIYYSVRFPDGWVPLVYRYDQFPEHVDHVDFWSAYATPLLAECWAVQLGEPVKRLQAALDPLCYGFPRGRVGKVSPNRYAVLNGGDLSKAITRRTIENAFTISGRCKWERDSHERCQEDEAAELQRVLGLTERWPFASAAEIDREFER